MSSYRLDLSAGFVLKLFWGFKSSEYQRKCWLRSCLSEGRRGLVWRGPADVDTKWQTNEQHLRQIDMSFVCCLPISLYLWHLEGADTYLNSCSKIHYSRIICHSLNVASRSHEAKQNTFKTILRRFLDPTFVLLLASKNVRRMYCREAVEADECPTLTTWWLWWWCNDGCEFSTNRIFLEFFQLTYCQKSIVDVGSLRILAYCKGCFSCFSTFKLWLWLWLWLLLLLCPLTRNICFFSQSLGLQDIHNLERSQPQDSGEERRPRDNEIDANKKSMDSAKRSAGSTISTLLHDKINPKNCQVLSLGDTGFLQFFRVVSRDYGKPRSGIWMDPVSVFVSTTILKDSQLFNVPLIRKKGLNTG